MTTDEPENCFYINVVCEEEMGKIPITISSDIPHLKTLRIERKLCDRESTWAEFLKLSQVQLDPDLYCARGSLDRTCELSDKVDQYVKLMKRNMKVYKVKIELKNPPVKRQHIKRRSTRRFSSQRGRSSRRIGFPSKLAEQKPSPKILTAINSEQVELPKEVPNSTSLESVQEIILSSSEGSSGASKPKTPRRSLPSCIVALPKSKKLQDFMNRANIPETGSAASTSTYEIPLVVPRKLMKRTSSLNAQSADRDSLRESDVANGLENGTNSATRGMLESSYQLRPLVLEYLDKNISNEQMLRIRHELFEVKKRDDYFKLTSISPLAAGLLDNMFFRPDQFNV